MAIYSDLNFNLTKSSTNDFDVLSTINTIKQSIKMNLLTKVGYHTKYEKPAFGSGIFNLLSEKPSKFVALQIQDHIEASLNNYEDRISVDDLSVTFDQINNLFEVSLTYTILSSSQQENLILTLNVIR